MKLLLILPVILVLVFASTSIAFAQEYSDNTVTDRKFITVHTDKLTYSEDDTIEITGSTNAVSKDIILTVTAPNGNGVSISKIAPMLNGEFTYVITTGGSLWKQDGFYTITAQQYNDLQYINSVQVYFKKDITYSKCGLGTIFNPIANSCVLIPDKKHRDSNENIPLQEQRSISENERLKVEIRDLKQQNNILQSEINDLRNIIYQQLDTIMKTLQRLSK